MKTAQLGAIGLFSMFLVLCFAAVTQGEKVKGPCGLQQAAAHDHRLAGRDLLQSANTNNGKNNDKNDGKNDGKGQRKCSGTTYTIKSGDTLSKLASKALEIEEKCSIEKIAKANPTLKNVNVILAGAKLCLPLGCKQPTQEALRG